MINLWKIIAPDDKLINNKDIENLVAAIQIFIRSIPSKLEEIQCKESMYFTYLILVGISFIFLILIVR